MRALSGWIAAATIATAAGPVQAQSSLLAQRAHDDYQNERWEQAASAYAQLARDRPRDGGVWYRLGRARLELNRVDQAIEALEKADAHGFVRQRTRYLLARAHARSGHPDRALDWLMRAVESGFHDAEAIRTEADFAGLHGQALYEAAVANAAEPVSFMEAGDALDFWLGSWDVYAGERLVGTNRIEKVLGGAAILEHWTPSGGSEGKSFFYYLPDAAQWKQVWVVHGAQVVKEKLSTPVDNGVRFEGITRLPDGREIPDRTTLTREEDGRVRQLIEASRDGGATWVVTFDAIYVPQAAR